MYKSLLCIKRNYCVLQRMITIRHVTSVPDVDMDCSYRCALLDVLPAHSAAALLHSEHSLAELYAAHWQVLDVHSKTYSC